MHAPDQATALLFFEGRSQTFCAIPLCAWTCAEVTQAGAGRRWPGQDPLRSRPRTAGHTYRLSQSWFTDGWRVKS